MAETTNIEWADSTLNIWEGCQETGSPACVGCYAKARNLRYAPKGTTEAPNWGPHAPRREVKSWRATLRKISRMALTAQSVSPGRPWFVFVNSLSDFWDNQADPKLRAEALAEFRKHPHLTFLLLTKRPQNIAKMAKAMCEAEIGAYVDSPGGLSGWWPRNAAIGCTVVTQAEADRDVPHLSLAAFVLRPAFIFLSMEPLAEVVDLTRIRLKVPYVLNALTGKTTMDVVDVFSPEIDVVHVEPRERPAIGWVITGGGTDQGKHKAYPTPYAAFRKVRDDCAAAGVAYLHKQNGEFVEFDHRSNCISVKGGAMRVHTDGKMLKGDRVVTASNYGDHRVTSVWAKVGKKAAGRMFDGRTYDARPRLAS